MADPYIQLIQDHWESVTDLYNQFAANRPVMLIDVQDGSIHAFPPDEFLKLLDAPSQTHLEQQYVRAVANRQMVLFVRDVERKIFQSYTLELEDN
jgi:hypothetical protein